LALSETLERAIYTCRQIFALFNGVSSVTLIDGERVLLALEGEQLKTGLEVGSVMPEGTLAREAFRTGSRVLREVATVDSKFGFGYSGIGIPIRDDAGEVVGALAFTSPLEKREILRDTAAQLKEMSFQTDAASREIAGAAGELAEALRTLSAQAAEAQKDVGAISDVADLIKQIAGQTNLLALNAAIEAARVGDQGRGFAVVAEEVRKLAQSTGDSVKDISQKLQSIIGAVDVIVRDVARLEELAQNQASSTEEINASMSEIAAGAEKVREVANELV
jgi:hypothetical protein